MTIPGYGSYHNPLSLSDGLSDTRISPGDTVWLRGGIYTGNFVCSLNGTEENPIIIRPYFNERPIIDGLLTINGQYTHWYGIEIYDSDMPRTSPNADDFGDIPNSGIQIYGLGTKIINCIFHDCKGVGFWSDILDGGEMNGCLSYYIGWQGSDRGHGHGVYTQNTSGTKQIIDCVFFDCFGWGVHAYTGDANKLNNLYLDGVVAARSGIINSPEQNHNNFLIGGFGETDDLYNLTMTDCYSYGELVGMDIGYNSGGDLATLTNLYAPDGILVRGDVTNVNNTNPYDGPDIGNEVFVHPNTYQSGRGNIIIYNQDQSDTIVVDVSSVMNVGDSYILRNVQDYFNDTLIGTVGLGGTISIDMRATSHTVSSPTGVDAPSAPPKMFPDFGIFVIEKV